MMASLMPSKTPAIGAATAPVVGPMIPTRRAEANTKKGGAEGKRLRGKKREKKEGKQLQIGKENNVREKLKKKEQSVGVMSVCASCPS